MRYPLDSDLSVESAIQRFNNRDQTSKLSNWGRWLHSPLETESLLVVYENGMYYIHCAHFLFSLENTYSEVNTYLWGRVTTLL